MSYAHASRFYKDKYAYVRYLDHIAKIYNSSDFINFVKTEKKLQDNPDLLYLLSLRNSVSNNNLLSLYYAKQCSYKVPKKTLEISKKLKDPKYHYYLIGEKWLASLGGF